MCETFAEFFQGFLAVFSVDLHDFEALLKEIFLSNIKMTVIKKGRNLVSFLPVFYYNLFLELETLFWIYLRDQNIKLGIYGLPFGNKNDNYKKKSHKLVIFYRFFYYSLFLELKQPFWIHPRDQNGNWAFLGFLSVIKTTVIKKGRNLVIFNWIFYYNLFLDLKHPFWIYLRN